MLPGTHNSMSSESLGWLIPNQIGDIPSQLRGGIRALLFDTHYGVRRADGSVATADPGFSPPPGPKETFLCHALCEIGATPLREGLGWIRDFLRTHRREVMVIVNEDYISPEDYATAVRESGLARYVYRGRTDRFPTLRRMIRRGQRVLMLAEHNAGTTIPWYHLAYDGILQETPYTFTTTAQLTDPAQLATSCRPNRGGTTAPLFLMNHWVLVNGAPSRAAAEIVNTRQAIVDRARACEKARGKLPTIVAVDSFGIGDLIGAVNELNGVRR